MSACDCCVPFPDPNLTFDTPCFAYSPNYGGFLLPWGQRLFLGSPTTNPVPPYTWKKAEVIHTSGHGKTTYTIDATAEDGVRSESVYKGTVITRAAWNITRNYSGVSWDNNTFIGSYTKTDTYAADGSVSTVWEGSTTEVYPLNDRGDKNTLTAILRPDGQWVEASSGQPFGPTIDDSAATVEHTDTFGDEGITFSVPTTLVAHNPTPTCYLKLWFAGGVTYEWSGHGNPCLNVAVKPVDAPENRIKGGAAYASQQCMVKWSLLPDYEPPDDGSANGVPVP